MTGFLRALDAFNAWVERHLLAGSADAYMRPPGPSSPPGPGGRAMSRTTALRIPCPKGSGDDRLPTPRLYPAWFWLYKNTRRLRHRLNLHDWEYPPVYNGGSYCTWCGKRRGIRLTTTDT